MCEIGTKLRIKTSELRQWRQFGVFIVNFEQISHIVLMLLLIDDFEEINAGWVRIKYLLFMTNENLLHGDT